jgi:hypothetical protein
MDETLQELENELKRLNPRRPSATLTDALQRELGPVPAAKAVRPAGTVIHPHWWKWALWSAAGAVAATLVVASAYFTRRSSPVPAASQPEVIVQHEPATEAAPFPEYAPVNRYRPVRATSVLYDMEEDGTAVLPDQSEGRQVRSRYVDTYTWRNPATNASLRWSVPRDEVRLVKARLD